MENFFEIVADAWPQLMHGLLYMLLYSVLGIVFALILGLISAMFKLSGIRPLQWLSKIYVELFRCTPLLVQIMFIFYGLPMVFPLRDMFGGSYDIFAAASALALNSGAYVTEIIRAGILSIDRGQKEAAASVGMNGYKSMIHVVLPQAFKRMIPPLVNQFAQTIKDTSLLAVVGISELIYTGQIIIAQNFKAFQIWTAVLVLYFVVIFIITLIANYIERRLQIDQR